MFEHRHLLLLFAALMAQEAYGTTVPYSTDVAAPDKRWADIGNCFSDDSSFYGDDDMKAEFERRAAAYNPSEYWDVVQWNIQCQAAEAAEQLQQGTKRKRDYYEDQSLSKTSIRVSRNLSPLTGLGPTSSLDSKTAYNPYEGDRSAKQLAESVNEFLTRLPPSKTRLETVGPWIWIANPYSLRRPTDENITAFRREGSGILEQYLSRKAELQQQHPNMTQSSIARLLKTDRDNLEARIMDLAKHQGVICGKWMLFLPRSEVDGVWATVAKAVSNDQLGPAAKVATDDSDPKNKYRLICIYTNDFSDIEDVKRILKELHKLGLVKNDQQRPSAIYYKCDAYTYLDISSGNEYNLKASMYNSRDLFSEMSTNAGLRSHTQN